MTLLLLMVPALAWAWSANERCEVSRDTEIGAVAVAPTSSGILLSFPPALVVNGTWITVSIGNRNWRQRVVGGAVELKGGVKPFLEKNWVSVHSAGDYLLGFSLAGTSEAWEKLSDCEPTENRDGWLSLAGEITASSDDQIIDAIRRQRPEGLLLDSVGGRTEEAQRIGYAVRDAGMATTVGSDGQCLSECTFILAAGKPRSVETGGRVGIPASMITARLGVFVSGQGSVLDSAAYFSSMGVDGGRLAVLATSNAQDGIRVLTPAELKQSALVDSTESGETTATAIVERFSSTDESAWWLIGGLLAVSALGWGLNKLWSGS